MKLEVYTPEKPERVDSVRSGEYDQETRKMFRNQLSAYGSGWSEAIGLASREANFENYKMALIDTAAEHAAELEELGFPVELQRTLEVMNRTLGNVAVDFVQTQVQMEHESKDAPLTEAKRAKIFQLCAWQHDAIETFLRLGDIKPVPEKSGKTMSGEKYLTERGVTFYEMLNTVLRDSASRLREYPNAMEVISKSQSWRSKGVDISPVWARIAGADVTLDSWQATVAGTVHQGEMEWTKALFHRLNNRRVA